MIGGARYLRSPVSPHPVFRLSLALAALLSALSASAQVVSPLPEELDQERYVAPDEIVSFGPETPFDQFIRYVNPLFQRRYGKTLVDPTGRLDPIGFYVTGLPYRDALDLVLSRSGLGPPGDRPVLPDRAGRDRRGRGQRRRRGRGRRGLRGREGDGPGGPRRRRHLPAEPEPRPRDRDQLGLHLRGRDAGGRDRRGQRRGAERPGTAPALPPDPDVLRRPLRGDPGARPDRPRRAQPDLPAPGDQRVRAHPLDPERRRPERRGGAGSRAGRTFLSPSATSRATRSPSSSRRASSSTRSPA